MRRSHINIVDIFCTLAKSMVMYQSHVSLFPPIHRMTPLVGVLSLTIPLSSFGIFQCRAVPIPQTNCASGSDSRPSPGHASDRCPTCSACGIGCPGGLQFDGLQIAPRQTTIWSELFVAQQKFPPSVSVQTIEQKSSGREQRT